MRVVNAKPINNGETLQIETDDDGDFRYIWIDSKYLKDVAYMIEKWDW